MSFYRFGLLGVMLCWACLSLQAQDLPAAHRLDLARLNHIYQGWNNCGPATLTMGLGYFGYPADTMAAQDLAADYLKPTSDDQNVSFWQMDDYVNQVIQADYNLRSLTRRGGDFETLKRLLVADFPLILGKGLEIPDEGWVGHFVLLIGYDDAAGAFLTYDSYKGHGRMEGLPQAYTEVQTLWQQFNNVFMVIYPVEREDEVQAILGELWQESAAWERARQAAEANHLADPSDLWAAFNLGEALTGLGRFEEATAAYEKALFTTRPMHWRVLWYMQGAFRAYYQVGDYARVERLARMVKQNSSFIEDVDYYLGLVKAAQGEHQAALDYFNKVLKFNANYYLAAEAKAQLEAGTFSAPTDS